MESDERKIMHKKMIKKADHYGGISASEAIEDLHDRVRCLENKIAKLVKGGKK